MRITIILVLIALLLVLASTTAYTVDRAEYVYVTQFGRHVATHDGRDGRRPAFQAPLADPVGAARGQPAAVLRPSRNRAADARPAQPDREGDDHGRAVRLLEDRRHEERGLVERGLVHSAGGPTGAGADHPGRANPQPAARAIGGRPIDYLFNVDGNAVERQHARPARRAARWQGERRRFGKPARQGAASLWHRGRRYSLAPHESSDGGA